MGVSKKRIRIAPSQRSAVITMAGWRVLAPQNSLVVLLVFVRLVSRCPGCFIKPVAIRAKCILPNKNRPEIAFRPVLVGSGGGI